MAVGALQRQAETTRPGGNDLALGIEGRCRELITTGETVRKRTVETSDQLMAQVTLIARLARDGLSNPEIAAQLFLSARTGEWRMRKIFTKLGIGSRRELREALPAVSMALGPDTTVRSVKFHNSERDVVLWSTAVAARLGLATQRPRDRDCR